MVKKGLRKQTNLQRGNHGGRWIDPQTDDETKTTILQKRMRRATQGQEWSQYQAGEWIRRSLLQGRTAPEDRKLSGFADRRCSPRLVCSPPSSRSKDEGGRRGPGWSRGEVGALRGWSYWSWDSSATDLKLHGTLFMKPLVPLQPRSNWWRPVL